MIFVLFEIKGYGQNITIFSTVKLSSVDLTVLSGYFI
jgi:hypothetical protein